MTENLLLAGEATTPQVLSPLPTSASNEVLPYAGFPKQVRYSTPPSVERFSRTGLSLVSLIVYSNNAKVQPTPGFRAGPESSLGHPQVNRGGDTCLVPARTYLNVVTVQ